MNLQFDKSLTVNYHSGTQIARILTENWVADNMFCPRCGNTKINHFPNNKPVADFYCPLCNNEFELKSKNGSIAHKVNDGAYETMINRITSNQNPDFFFMNYSKEKQYVKDFFLVPKHFFVPDIIEKRKPLSTNARRAGWIGCNILIDKIPPQGKIDIIVNGVPENITTVVKKVNKSAALEISDISSRSWIIDVLNCVNKIQTNEFLLSDIYSFQRILSLKHPNNNNIQAKIRQQLQILRDKGFIDFLGQGRYRKIQ
jgi:type II restriction enzyme